MPTPERLARLFHETYEEVMEESQGRLYTPTGSKAWDEIPTMTRRLFIEICRRIIAKVDTEDEPIKSKWR